MVAADFSYCVGVNERFASLNNIEAYVKNMLDSNIPLVVFIEKEVLLSNIVINQIYGNTSSGNIVKIKTFKNSLYSSKYSYVGDSYLVSASKKDDLSSVLSYLIYKKIDKLSVILCDVSRDFIYRNVDSNISIDIEIINNVDKYNVKQIVKKLFNEDDDKQMRNNIPKEFVSSTTLFDCFEPGRTHLVIGKNGSGKTRLLNTIKNKRFGRTIIKLDFATFKFNFDISSMPNDYKSYNPSTINLYDTDLKSIDTDHILDTSVVALIGDELLFKEQTTEYYSKYGKLMNYSFYNNKIKIVDDGKQIEINSSEELMESLQKMSPGQRNMLCLTLVLGALEKKHSSDEIVFLLDEPESHLFPKVSIELIKILQNSFKKSEVWIATHSTHIMSSILFKDILYVKDGCIMPKTYDTRTLIYEEMIGLEDSALDELIFDSYSRDFISFVKECSHLPGSYSKIYGDDKLKEIFCDLFINKKVVRILDIGCGTKCLYGKLFDYLKDKILVHRSIDIVYEIVDLIEVENIKTPRCFNRYYNSIDDVIGEYDFILMNNSLHEFSISSWVPLFDQIKNHLDTNGFIWFSEMDILKYGESPNEDRTFLILGPTEIKLLFEIDPKEYVVSNLMQNKCNYAIVPKDNLNGINTERVLNVLKSLIHTSKINYWRCCDKKKNPRLMAFYAVQLINAERALEILISSSTQ